MENRLQVYVDELFREAPDSQRAYEASVELAQNLIDKYHDLLSGGKSEEDAYAITVDGIGDISELLEQLRREENAVPKTEEETKPIWEVLLGSYWSLITAAYFLFSFLTGRWDITWVIFIAAPALHSVLCTFIKKK